jgi:hypothetical protein
MDLKINKGLVFALISLNLFIATTVFESVYAIPNIVKYIFSVFALYQILRFYFKSERKPIDTGMIEGVRLVFTLMSIFLLITSVRFEKFYLQEVFGDQFFFLPYLTPIIFININIKPILFKPLIYYSYRFLFIALLVQIYVILFTLSFEYYVKDVVGILSFTLLPIILLAIPYYFSYKYSFILTLAYFIFFAIIYAVLGRRGETFEVVFIIIWAFVIKFGSKQLSSSKKISLFIFVLFFFITSTQIIIANKSEIYLFERGFNKSGFDESRGETVDNFISDFGSMTTDWIIGRGLNGTVRKFDSGEHEISRSIEIGYFNILLKGGLLYLVPMMLLFITGFFRGFFYSKNDLVKTLSGLLLLQIINMLSFGMANYNASYTILWIATAICLNPVFRAYSNEDVIKMLSQNKS